MLMQTQLSWKIQLLFSPSCKSHFRYHWRLISSIVASQKWCWSHHRQPHSSQAEVAQVHQAFQTRYSCSPLHSLVPEKNDEQKTKVHSRRWGRRFCPGMPPPYTPGSNVDPGTKAFWLQPWALRSPWALTAPSAGSIGVRPIAITALH